MTRLGLFDPHGFVLAMILAVLCAGCSSAGLPGLGLATGTIPYQPSNAIMAAGYSETALDPDHYRIVVTGYLSTPRELLEKMVATRAAEIGTEQHLRYFKIVSVAHSMRCESFNQADRHGRGERRDLKYAVLTAEVSYAKSPPDASYIESKQAFPQYKAALDADVSPALPVDPAAQCS